MTYIIQDAETKTYRALTEDDIPDGLINLDQPYAIVRSTAADLIGDISEIIGNVGEDSANYNVDSFVYKHVQWWGGVDEHGVEHTDQQGVFLPPMDDDDFWEHLSEYSNQNVSE